MPIVLCAQLPTSRLLSYGAFSVLIACFAFWRSSPLEEVAYSASSDKQSFLSLERAMQDNYIVVATFNMVLCLLIVSTKAFQCFFFGPLVGTEAHFIREKLTHFALSRAVFLIGVINATKWSSLLGWTLWFSCFSCLHGFSRLARPRCEQLLARGSTSRKQWLHFGSMLVILTCATIVLFATGIQFCYYLSDVTPEADIFGELGARYSSDPSLEEAKDETDEYADEQTSIFYQIVHVIVFMFSDTVLILMLLLQIALVIAIHKLDGNEWMRRTLAYDKASWLYNVNAVFDVLSLSLDFSNHVHMLIWSRLASLTSLVVTVQIFISYGELSQRMRRHAAYRKLVKIVRREFPLEHIDQKAISAVGDSNDQRTPDPELCAICWELLWTWRKLPCNHCFHETCLTMWMEHDATCPTCRRQVLPQSVNPQAQAAHMQQRAPQAPENTTLRELLNFFDLTDAPPPPTQRAVRGMAVRFRQHGGANAGQHTQVNGPSLDLSIRVSLGPGRRAPQRPANAGGQPVSSINDRKSA